MSIDRRTFAKMLAVGSAGVIGAGLSGCTLTDSYSAFLSSLNNADDTNDYLHSRQNANDNKLVINPNENTNLGVVDDIAYNTDGIIPNPYDIKRTIPPYNGTKVSVSVEPQRLEELGTDTYTGLPSLSENSYILNDPENERGLSTAHYGYTFGAASGGNPHRTTVNNQN
ncbi:MAG: hypothetical protein J6Y65_00975, partial [Eggerthellaceae bacterium]|nr:hypothetical protein [Eggerthellaceae bacterium]